MSASKYGAKVPPLTMEPLRCVRCRRSNVTLLRTTDKKGRPCYGCTDCAGTRRRIA